MASPSMRVTAQTSSFQQQMKAMVESMKRVSSEYKLSATQAKLAGDSAGVYKAKIVELTEKIKLQKQSIESQEKHLSTQQDRMDKLTQKNTQLKEEVENLSKAYEKNKNELGANNEETKAAKEALEKKQEALKKNEQAITSQSLAIDKSTTKLNNSKAELVEYEQELKDTNTSLKLVEAGLDDAGKEMQDSGQKAVTFGDLLKSSVAADIITAGLRKIKDSIIDVSKAALNVGMNFEASMSQVAATMGFTVEQIQNGDEGFKKLEEAAKKCGEETQFSASEAADALNYLALAGYDVDKSVETLPTVLNLAAAGGMDLALASDMVTDSMSALGDMAGSTESFVDKMAKTSQKSNTNVTQLGEAILTVGGTAKVLNGGVTEMNTALGILADNGIKGSEGGTALRNVILALTAPTDKSAKAIKKLGLDVYDSAGKLRPMNEIFQDLDGKLSKMNDGKKTQVLNTIFNKVDLKSANALLANSGKRFEELSGYINNSNGAAENMAATLNDNVKGKITIFKSGLEGLGISIYEKFKEPIGNAIDSVTKNISSLTTSIKNGSLDSVIDGIAKKFAEVITKATDFASAALPKVIDGLTWISKHGAEIKAVLAGIAAGFVAFKIATVITALSQAFGALKLAVIAYQATNVGATTAQAILNTTIMACPLMWIVAAIGLVVGAIALLWQKNEGFRNFFTNAWGKIKSGLSTFVDFVKNNWQGVLLFIANPIVGGFKLAYDNCEGFRTKVNQILTTVIDFLKNNWQGILLFIANPIVGGFKLAYDNCVGFRTKVDQILNTVINFVKKNWVSLLTFLINPFVGLFTYFYNNNSKFRNFVDNAYNSLKQLPGKIWSAIQGGITKVKNFGSQLLSSGKDAAKQLKDGIVNGAKSIPDSMKSIGKNVVDGVWNGIKNAKAQFTKNIKGFFSGIVDSAKSALDIHSPSRRGEKEVGEEFGNGVIKGVLNKFKQAKEITKDFASTFVDTAKVKIGEPVLSKINEIKQITQVDAISSNINTQKYTDDRAVYVTVYTNNTTTLDKKVIAKELKKEVVDGITKDKTDYELAKGVC